MLSHRFSTAKDDDDWQNELQAWGITEEPDKQPELIPLYEENLEVVEWWLTIPGFLKFSQSVCLGMDVLAVKADAELSGRSVQPQTYKKLKHIARIVTEELNQREQPRS